ncbi:hypothetical protein MWW80_003104, partial [Escherichia coli]|nr:hypothetical protein [Escherichia coli]
MTRTLKPLILNTSALTLTLILIYTGISAHDKLTWLMEVTPVIIVVQLLLATARRYPLTPLLYTLIFLHAIGNDSNLLIVFYVQIMPDD